MLETGTVQITRVTQAYAPSQQREKTSAFFMQTIAVVRVVEAPRASVHATLLNRRCHAVALNQSIGNLPLLNHQLTYSMALNLPGPHRRLKSSKLILNAKSCTLAPVKEGAVNLSRVDI